MQWRQDVEVHPQMFCVIPHSFGILCTTTLAKQAEWTSKLTRGKTLCRIRTWLAFLKTWKGFACGWPKLSPLRSKSLARVRATWWTEAALKKVAVRWCHGIWVRWCGFRLSSAKPQAFPLVDSSCTLL